MRYFAHICAHARSGREFAKCRFAHFPSFVSVHFDTYVTYADDIAQTAASEGELADTMNVWQAALNK